MFHRMAFALLCWAPGVLLAAAVKPHVDASAAEALLRTELATFELTTDVCVTADGKPLAADSLQRLRDSGIHLASDKARCVPGIEILLSDFSFRPEYGTFELRFTSQLFGGSNVAVMKHFGDGWHVISTYPVGVWL